MPKERIHHGRVILRSNNQEPGAPFTGPEPWYEGMPVPEDMSLTNEPSLDVSWNREGEWVQLAFDGPVDWWDRFIKGHSDEQLSYSAYTEVLTRKEINHLIRTLKRARDAAYGADE